jgi:hypothetical protein
MPGFLLLQYNVPFLNIIDGYGKKIVKIFFSHHHFASEPLCDRKLLEEPYSAISKTLECGRTHA